MSPSAQLLLERGNASGWLAVLALLERHDHVGIRLAVAH
jgi:hypothetical protein